jgi:hypothetical protein
LAHCALQQTSFMAHWSQKALADLIDMLGLDNNGAEGQGLSNKASHGEGKSTSDAPLHPPKKDALLDSQRPGTPPAELLLPPSPTTPKRATMSASHRSTLDRSNSLTKPTLPSLHKGLNQSFHPILDIEVKKLSLPVTRALKSTPLHPHLPRDRPVPEPHGPRSNRKSFLPDMSGWVIQTEARPRKIKRPATAPQPSKPYMDQLPPTLDSLLTGKKGKSQTNNILPRLSSRSAKPPPPHWPPVSPPQPAPLSQNSGAITPPTRPHSLKASRFERRASRTYGSDSSLGSSVPPLPIMPHPNTYSVDSPMGGRYAEFDESKVERGHVSRGHEGHAMRRVT